MSIYRRTVYISAIVSVLSLVLSILCSFVLSNPFTVWLNTILTGLFSSGILVCISSLVGYFIEEEKTLHQYHWKISELKYAAIELQTFPDSEKNWTANYEKISRINYILKNYFAILDKDFIFHKRKRIQKLLEIDINLYPLVKLTDRAMECLRVYLNEKTDDMGNRCYGHDEFIGDMHDIAKQIDNYNDSGKMLAMWLVDKEREYGDVVFNLKNEEDS